MRGVAAVAILAALALAGGACYRFEGEAEVGLYRIERKDFVQRVTADGYLEAVEATAVAVPAVVRQALRVAWVAPEGKLVEKGELLFRFDTTELEQLAEEAAAEMHSAELKLQRQRAEARAEEGDLQRDSELAALEAENRGAFLKRDAEIYSRFEIVESEVGVEMARVRQRHAEESLDRKQRMAQSERELLELDRRRVELELRRTAEALQAVEVRAPRGGLFLLERDWRGIPPRLGDEVFSGQKLAQIPDLTEMQVQVLVLEADAGGLEPGQPARVVVESRPDTTYGGEVARVDTVARPRSSESPVQYFGVTLRLADTDPEVMKPGQRVRAEILARKLEDVLQVPRQAVTEEGGQTFVHRRQQGRLVRTPVKLGPAGLGWVVVEEGLEEGESIAARDPGISVDPSGGGSPRPAAPSGAGGAG